MGILRDIGVKIIQVNIDYLANQRVWNEKKSDGNMFLYQTLKGRNSIGGILAPRINKVWIVGLWIQMVNTLGKLILSTLI